MKYLFLLFVLVGQSAMAEFNGLKYTLEYDKNSPINTISLKNAALKLKVYVFAEPNGFIDAKTDDNQAFTLDKNYGPTAALKVLSIGEALKQHIDCEGSAIPGETKIEIICVKD